MSVGTPTEKQAAALAAIKATGCTRAAAARLGISQQALAVRLYAVGYELSDPDDRRELGLPLSRWGHWWSADQWRAATDLIAPSAKAAGRALCLSHTRVTHLRCAGGHLRPSHIAVMGPALRARAAEALMLAETLEPAATEPDPAREDA